MVSYHAIFYFVRDAVRWIVVVEDAGCDGDVLHCPCSLKIVSFRTDYGAYRQ
jgi:hypothetical protein